MPADDAGEVLLASMKLNGIDRIWFTSGSEMGFVQEGSVKARELGRPAPRVMTITHEAVALAAACGETVVTGKPSAAAFHVECGMLNAGGMYHVADRGRYPVLVTSGYPSSAEANSVPGARSSFIQYYQQIRDQGELIRQYMRWDHKLAPYDNPGTVISRAVQVMLSDPRGPAYLAIPRESSMAPIASGQTRFPLTDQLRPVSAPPPDAALLREAAAWLLASNNPLIVAGRVGTSHEALAPLVELAETLGARVMSDAHRLSFPGSHPLHRGVAGVTPLTGQPDCILSLDQLTPWIPGRFDPGPDVRLIRIGLDPAERWVPIYEFPSDLSIVGDAVAAIPLLVDEIRRQRTPEQRRACEARLEKAQEEGRQRLARLVATAESDRARGVIHALWLSHQIGQTLDPETLVVQETVETALFNRTLPGTQVASGGSNLGWAAPASVGMKVAAPDRQVVSVTGDGAWMFSNPQVTTWASAFHKAPVLFIIFNNRGYRTGTTDVERAYPEGYVARTGDFTGGLFDPCPNYSGEASASGAYGEKVTEPDQVGPAIRRGLAANREGAPAVLDVWLPKIGPGLPTAR
ncbi:MAG: thiamine pyrophosphate-requiring protein [Chloroflexi bacterium]|nr:thiamine pyrophosphate-requiring protein [Chloroflexota bacterium]